MELHEANQKVEGNGSMGGQIAHQPRKMTPLCEYPCPHHLSRYASAISTMACAGGYSTESFCICHRTAAGFAFTLGIPATPATRQTRDPSR